MKKSDKLNKTALLLATTTLTTINLSAVTLSILNNKINNLSPLVH